MLSSRESYTNLMISSIKHIIFGRFKVLIDATKRVFNSMLYCTKGFFCDFHTYIFSIFILVLFSILL